MRSAGLLRFSSKMIPGAAGVIKQIFGQKYHAFNQVVFYKPFANIALPTGLLASRSARHRTGIEDNRGASRSLSGRRVYAAPTPNPRRNLACNAIGESSPAVVGVERHRYTPSDSTSDWRAHSQTVAARNRQRNKARIAEGVTNTANRHR